MATVEKGDSFGKQICSILGLDVDKTNSITIKIQPDFVVKVEIEQILQESEGEGMIEILKCYRLTGK